MYKPLLKKRSQRFRILELVASKVRGDAYELVKYNNFETWEEFKLKTKFEVRKSVEQL